MRPISSRHRIGEMRQRLPEGAGLPRRFSYGMTLVYRLVEQIARRHQLVFFALLQNADDLIDRQRHAVQARQIVLVLFGSCEGHKADKRATIRWPTMHFRQQTTESMIPWGESIRFALNSIAAEKLKASLTTLAVVIGSAAIVLVVTIGSTGESYMVSLIEGVGANLAYATLNRGASTVLDDELTPGDLAAVHQGISAVRVIAGTYDVSVDLHIGGKAVAARLVGVTSDFEKIRNLRITSGRYFDEDESRSRFKVCLITDNLARSAFGFDPAVGNTAHFGDFRCTIIGTFNEGVPTFGRSEIQDSTLLIPFPLVKDITGDNFFQVLYAQAASSSEVPAMTQQMDHLLHNRHRKEARYSVENLASLLETASKVSFAFRAVLLAVAVLTLTVAGTGIMNIMFFNVAERTHEIGLRKALGARPAEIRLQFLLEALFISFTGAVVGVVTALAFLLVVTGLVRNTVPLSISWTSVVVALLVPSGIGVLFGYRPASDAANLSPIDALRIE
jgi:putative ABC transport system permease protein